MSVVAQKKDESKRTRKMGNRYLTKRHLHAFYSERRRGGILNEDARYQAHQIRPYGLASKKFSYKSMFEKKHNTRLTNKAATRAAKKSVRQRVKNELMKEERYEYYY